MWPFGETVLLWRLYRGFSQTDLAAKAGLTRPNLSAIESGTREATLGTVRALSLALNANPGDLAGGRSPYGAPVPLSREALERIARATIDETVPASAAEAAITKCLRLVTATRLAAHAQSARPKLSRLACTHAYLQLKAMTSAGVINSPVARLDALLYLQRLPRSI